MGKYRLLISESGDVSYTEYNTEREAVKALANYCSDYVEDKGYNVHFEVNGRAIIETEHEVIAFGCVFPPLVTE